MRGRPEIRRHSTWQGGPAAVFAAALCVVLPAAPAWGGAGVSGRAMQQEPAPIERRPPSSRAQPQPEARPAQRGAPGQAGNSVARGEHLAEWMNQHSNLTPEQQQSALSKEPGFRELPQQTQQRYRDRLTQLNAMSPAQRQRVLARNEAMERLTPEQRADVRHAMGDLGSLPLDDRRQVARTFRALRELPPEQRIGAYATGRYGPPLNDTQRGVLFNLLRVEPMLPPPANSGGGVARSPDR